jgi:hypothetical protein
MSLVTLGPYLITLLTDPQHIAVIMESSWILPEFGAEQLTVNHSSHINNQIIEFAPQFRYAGCKIFN